MSRHPHSVRPAAALIGLLALGVCVAPLRAHAVPDPDPLIEGARQCTQYFPGQERDNNIPSHLLAAIATTESGRFHQGLGMSVPWPWTINVEGKGYFFKSKAEAIAQTQNFLAKGYQSIDVGCMQVNLKHHPKAFSNLNEAFDPAVNVAYAAKFLRDNYASLGDWIKATAAYHSRTPVHGERYLVEIEKSWNRIVGKVAAARASKTGKGADVAAAMGGSQPTSAGRVAASTETARPRVISVSRQLAERPMAEAKRVRVVKVSDATTARRSSEVMVVRAEAAPAIQPVAVAEAAPLPSQLQQENSSSIRRVSLDNPASAGVPSSASGPHFVFAN